MKNSELKIMLIDDDELFNKSMSNVLEMEGYNVETFISVKKALNYLESNGLCFNIIITDINMPEIDGLSFIKILKERHWDSAEILVLTGYGSIENAVNAIKLGAAGFFEKQADPQLLLLEIEKIKRTIELQKKRYGFYLFHFKSTKMNKIFSMARKIAEKDVNILITGESGTGKEILARYIHHNSSRKNKCFIPVNCSSIPDTLFESEMFGYAKGSFTGAVNTHEGYFQRAEGGTLFLDEIGEISSSCQAKLLRVLEDGSFYPIGGKNALQADCRIISATNADLNTLVDSGKFRKDLFFRINTIVFNMPPLRERKEDILDLANCYLDFFNKKYQKDIKGFTTDARNWLINQEWPGNMRELNHVIERSVLFSYSDKIDIDILNDNINKIKRKDSLSDIENEKIIPYRIAKQRFEISYFQKAIKICKGNITEMAKKIELERTYIYRKLKELGI